MFPAQQTLRIVPSVPLKSCAKPRKVAMLAAAGGSAAAGENGAGPGSNGAGPAPPRRSLATKLVHCEGYVNDEFGGSMPPIYQTATFQQPDAVSLGEYDYSRSGNPTRSVLERMLADIEGGTRALAFASGMAALSAVTRLLDAGDHIVAGDDLYGGTSRLLSRIVPPAGVAVSNVNTSDVEAICDIAAICEAAHAAGALVCVDNSMLTCLYQRPLDLGADIAMTSATKFAGGHSDVSAGVLVVRDPALADRLYFIQNAVGSALGPFDCWLLVRGLKTMALRMERQTANAGAIAAWLVKHPLVKQVNYPGLSEHPGHDVHFRQATGSGSVLSFTTGDAELSRALCEAAQLHKITVSFGNVCSLISMPCFMSHAAIPPEVRAARGLPDDLVRISVGIEALGDLIADLDQAFAAAEAAVAAARCGAGV
eukprot:scaffold25.g5089.t1